MSADDRKVRLEALTRLALATREKPEPQTYVVYLEDTARERTDVLLEACRRLEKSSAWFPKVAELLAECAVIAKHRREAEDQKRLLMPANFVPAAPGAAERFKAMVEKIVREKRMPATRPSDKEWADRRG